MQTAGYRTSEITIPLLAIAYCLDHEEHVIHLIDVVVLAEVVLDAVQAEPIVREYHERPDPEAFERVVQRALRGAGGVGDGCG